MSTASGFEANTDIQQLGIQSSSSPFDDQGSPVCDCRGPRFDPSYRRARTAGIGSPLPDVVAGVHEPMCLRLLTQASSSPRRPPCASHLTSVRRFNRHVPCVEVERPSATQGQVTHFDVVEQN
jgi:hypothetical protein